MCILQQMSGIKSVPQPENLAVLLLLVCLFAIGACDEGRSTYEAAGSGSKPQHVRPATASALMRPPPTTTSSPTAVAPSPETMAVLGAGLSSEDWMTRSLATSVLGCIPGSQSLLWLEQRLADVEEDVRAEAITGLAHRANLRARALLVSVQNDTEEQLSLRVLAASALARPTQTCR